MKTQCRPPDITAHTRSCRRGRRVSRRTLPPSKLPRARAQPPSKLQGNDERVSDERGLSSRGGLGRPVLDHLQAFSAHKLSMWVGWEPGLSLLAHALGSRQSGNGPGRHPYFSMGVSLVHSAKCLWRCAA